MKQEYHYHINSENAPITALEDMYDKALKVKSLTFLKHVSFYDIQKVFSSYILTTKMLKNNSNIDYFKSYYAGFRCYYLKFSYIDHIWIKN